MDPFTFGLVVTGAFGGGLLLLTGLEKLGIGINETALTIVFELIKAGGLLMLIEKLSMFL